MKEIEEIQSLVKLIRNVGDIDKEDYDRIISATESIESKIKQLESENEKAYSIINNYLGIIVEGNQHFDKLYDLINKLQAENESLKCCGNCGGRNYPNCHYCSRGTYKCNPIQDNWQPKENK